MNPEIRGIFERQAAWQRARAKRPWADKLRDSVRMRKTVLALREKMTEMKPPGMQLVVCVRNDGFPASLQRGKAYQALPDPNAEGHGMTRVVDASGNDYMYPSSLFVPLHPSERDSDVLDGQHQADIEWGLNGDP